MGRHCSLTFLSPSSIDTLMNKTEFIAKSKCMTTLQSFYSKRSLHSLKIRVTLLKFPLVQYFVCSLVSFFSLYRELSCLKIIFLWFSAKVCGQALRALSPQETQPLSPLGSGYNANLSGLWILGLIREKVKPGEPTSCLNTILSSVSLCSPEKWSSPCWWPFMQTQDPNSFPVCPHHLPVVYLSIDSFQ